MRFLILAALVVTMALATAGGLLMTSTVSHENATPPRESYLPVAQPSATPTPTTTTAKYTLVAKVVKKKDVSYLEVSIKYGAAGRFTVKQKVCKGSSCRTVTSSIPVTTGAATKTVKLGKGSYRLSGKPKVTVKVLPWPTRTVTATPKVTATATVTTGPTVTQSVAGPTTTITVSATVTITATATATATSTVTATITETPSGGTTTTVTVTTAPPPNAGCDAPWNPYRYYFCTTEPTAVITTLAPELCTYFQCLTSPLPAPTAGQRLMACTDGKIFWSTPTPSPDPCANNGALKGDVLIAPEPAAGAQALTAATGTPTPTLTPAPPGQ
ncbi:hypothetical protein ACIBH1_32435 [Nonomuraea sp. NPDC050663]|uniref:hypothetical protein n=1 Tax=Nonomuraea sp. NPDC050663 TaxID=3364370 RepID=UPI0037BDC179